MAIQVSKTFLAPLNSFSIFAKNQVTNQCDSASGSHLLFFDLLFYPIPYSLDLLHEFYHFFLGLSLSWWLLLCPAGRLLGSEFIFEVTTSSKLLWI